MNSNRNGRSLGVLGPVACVLLVVFGLRDAQAQTQTIPATHGPWLTGGASSCGAGQTMQVSAQARADILNNDPTSSYNYTLDFCAVTWTGMAPQAVDSFAGACRAVVPIQGAGTAYHRCQMLKTHKSNGQPAGSIYWYPTRHVSCPAGLELQSDPSAPGQYRCKIRSDDTCPVGNPGSLATAAKLHDEWDIRPIGGSPLEFRRFYTSVGYYAGAYESEDAPRSGLTDYWGHSYSGRIYAGDTTDLSATALRPDGSMWFFDATGKEILNAGKRGASARIMPLGGGGWRLTTEKHDQEDYDAAGRLTLLRTRAGLEIEVSYDGAGRIASARDSFGHVLTFVHDGQGNLASVIDPAGQAVTYAYAGSGRTRALVGVTYPDLTSKQYHNEVAGRPHLLTGISDESASRFSTYTYNTASRLIASEHAGGVNRHEFTHEATFNRTLIKDPLGVIRTHNYVKSQGVYRLASIAGSVCSTCGSAMSLIYYTNGNVKEHKDFKGNVTRYSSYDSARNLETSRTEAYNTPRARTITTQWHPTFRLPTQIDEPGKRTTFTHDANGNVLTKTLLDTTTSESRAWTYTYNNFGKVLSADGPRTDVADVTTYTYYSCTTGFQCGQIETIANAAGHITTYNTYNAHGQPLTVTDPNGVVTTLTYDLRQRLTARTVGTEQVTFSYWPAGLLKRVTLPDGRFIEYTYDAAHRLTQLSDSQGNRAAYTLDAMGNRTQENVFDSSSTLTQTRTRVFNTLNQLWKEIGAAGTAAVTTSFAYDNNSNVTNINAPLGRNTVQGYDELDRLTQVTDPQSAVTLYGYNALDQLISVTDPRSKVTTYTYNALGDLKQQVSPDTGTTVNTYDSGGNPATSVDARSKTGTYGYDALNRITSLTFPDQTITYTYDTGTNQKGRLRQVSDASGSTSWSYDTHGRVLTKQQAMGAVTKTVAYAYDSFGRLQTLTLPSGNSITYGYTDGKVTSLALNGATTIVSNVLYRPFGPTTGWTWGNGTFAVREYDIDGKITDVDSAGLKTFGYDDASRITGITDAGDPNLSQSFGYDLLDRLTNATGASLNQGWTYDANGNRLTQTGSDPSTYTTSGTSNRITSVTGSLTRTYDHDDSGRPTSDGIIAFAYDDAGRLVSATKAATSTTYSLNAMGKRVRKATAGNATYFVYDEAGHVLGEYDSSGGLIQETIWFDDIPLAVLKPAGSSVNVFYVHTDHLNTPRRISRPSDNAIVWRWDSDPFGSTPANEDPDGDTQVFSFNLRFAGQYFDVESGLHYNYFRDYDPSTGRYVQSDPIGLAGGLNTYSYAAANPLSLIDPLGLQVAVPVTSPVPPPASPGTGERPTSGPYIEQEWLRDTAQRISDLIERLCTTEEDCQKLYAEIKTRVSEVKRRYWEYIADKLVLAETGPNSREGHRRAFWAAQRGLRNALQQADTKGCLAYDADAWDWATRELVEIPNPNRPPGPGSRPMPE